MSDQASTNADVSYDPVDLQLVSEGLHETGRWKYARPVLSRVIDEMVRLRAENAALREAGDELAHMADLLGEDVNDTLCHKAIEAWRKVSDE